jgi:hypothetical protein
MITGIKHSNLRLIFTGISLLLITGCSIFDTRNAEPPDTGNTGVFMQPDRPEVVLDNLISAVENLNTVNYLRCLTEPSFEFIPSSSALNSSPEIWTNWSIDAERTYFNNMRAASENTRGHRLSLSNISTELSSSNSRQIFANYSLTILHNRSNVGVPTMITGRFALQVEMSEDGLWAITSWTDISIDNNYSWSDLRANFYRD